LHGSSDCQSIDRGDWHGRTRSVRVAARTKPNDRGPSRLNFKGEPMDGHSAENMQVDTIYKEGKFYE